MDSKLPTIPYRLILQEIEKVSGVSPSAKHQQHEAHLSWRIKSVSLWFFFSPVSEKNYSQGESAGLYDDIVFWNVKVAGMWSAMSSGPCAFGAWKEPFRAAPLALPPLVKERKKSPWRLLSHPNKAAFISRVLLSQSEPLWARTSSITSGLPTQWAVRENHCYRAKVTHLRC